MESNSLVKMAFSDMLNFDDSWRIRAEKIKQILNIKSIPGYVSKGSVASQTKLKLNSIFDRFWIEEINQVKIGPDGLDHNKLRFYKTLKTSFKVEPYIELVQNRNQRCNLTRIRISAHQLEVELLRYSVPKVPYPDRLCNYCTMQVPGDEVHFMGFCETFMNKRQCLIGKLSSLNPKILEYSKIEQVTIMLCPTTAQATKLVNKYIHIIFKARENIDNGEHISNLTFPPNIQNYECHDISLDESFVSSTSNVFSTESSSEDDYDNL